VTPPRRPVFPGELRPDQRPVGTRHVSCGGEVRPTLDAQHLGCVGCNHLWKWSTVQRFTAEELALRFCVESPYAPAIDSELPPKLVWLWADNRHSAYVVGRCYVVPDGAERISL
jgi:hypothetical protein